MPYYDTIEEDLARAKAMLAKGRPAPWEAAHFTPAVIEALRKTGGGTIYGADIYAAYKLLESFVAEIERLRAAFEQIIRESEARTAVLEQLQQRLELLERSRNSANDRVDVDH